MSLRHPVCEPTGAELTACCNLPPVQAEYTNKGEYTEINGLKTYVTGDKDSKQAILIVYDVFGFKPQIHQGPFSSHLGSSRADRIGADLLASQGFAVYMPDFLDGDYAEASWFDGSEEYVSTRQS